MENNQQNNKYDVIIAGSGLGGLVCGYILAKNGYKVAVFEKNAQIGGCLQTFKRGGVVFGTGMHYIGSMDRGQIMHRFFKYLNLLDDVKISSMDKNCYEVVAIGNDKYRLASGAKRFQKNLSKQFPENADEIAEYVKKIAEIAKSSPLYHFNKMGSSSFIDSDYFTTSVNDFIENITKNKRLQAVLAGNMMLYGGVKDKTPIYIHSLMTNFYMQSPYRIKDGSHSIANSLTKSIKKFGGDVFTNSEVMEFICDEKKMTKIRLKNNQEFEAEYFISNIHPQITLEKIKSNLLRKVYRDRINNIENTPASFTVFIKFKANSAQYLNYNFHYYDNDDIWDLSEKNKTDFPASYYYLHQAGDDERFANTAEIVAFMNIDEVKQWENTTVGNRGEDYKNFKNEYAQKVLDKVEKSFPGFKETVENFWVATPLTYRDYTATPSGSMYGIVRDKNFPIQTRISQRTKIPNFYFTGQNINSHGILGVIVGSIITCAEILGMEKIIKDIK